MAPRSDLGSLARATRNNEITLPFQMPLFLGDKVKIVKRLFREYSRLQQSRNWDGTTYSLLTEAQHPQPIVDIRGSCVSTVATLDAVIVIDTWRCV